MGGKLRISSLFPRCALIGLRPRQEMSEPKKPTTGVPTKAEFPAKSPTVNPAPKSAVSFEDVISGLRIEHGRQRRANCSPNISVWRGGSEGSWLGGGTQVAAASAPCTDRTSARQDTAALCDHRAALHNVNHFQASLVQIFAGDHRARAGPPENWIE